MDFGIAKALHSRRATQLPHARSSIAGAQVTRIVSTVRQRTDSMGLGVVCWRRCIARQAVAKRGTAWQTDGSKTGSLDQDSISLGDEYEVREWTMNLGCTEVELRAVVQAIGNNVDKVRAYFHSK